MTASWELHTPGIDPAYVLCEHGRYPEEECHRCEEEAEEWIHDGPDEDWQDEPAEREIDPAEELDR